MIKKKEQLFQLIKSLSKEEKRHFKLYVNKYNSTRENNYLKLFNAIDKQEVYNEAAIKEQFKEETFIRQLTVTKHYLQKQIMRSLQNLHYDDTVDLSMLALHHQLAVMYKKGHYEICRELVKKGLEVSSKHERFLEWIGFLKWELDLINKMDIEEYKRSLSKYMEKTSQLLSWYEINTLGNHIINEIELFSLNTPTFGTKSSYYENLIEKIETLINGIDLANLPLKTRFNLYFPLALSYLSIVDYVKAYELYWQIYNDMKDDYIAKELHEEFINTLTGLIYCSGALNKPDSAKTALNELKNIPDVNRHIEFRKAESLSFFPLINCALSGDLYNGLTAIEIIESFLQNYQDKIMKVQYIYAYYYAAYIYIGGGNYNLALKYLRKADALHSRELLPNLRLGIKLMEIIIFYEQKKYELVESRLRSLQRQLLNEENIKSFLKIFSKYFQKLILLAHDSNEEVKLYKLFLENLLGMNRRDQISLFIFFDLISWLQSKIDGTTPGEKIKLNGIRLFAEMSAN